MMNDELKTTHNSKFITHNSPKASEVLGYGEYLEINKIGEYL
jgi:hypothetical protein